jgi:hypothetical protein
MAKRQIARNAGNPAEPIGPEIAPEVKPIAAKPAEVVPSIVDSELGPSKQEQIRRFEGNGIAYCKTCIRTFQTGEGDVSICPINKPGCDRNKLGG